MLASLKPKERIQSLRITHLSTVLCKDSSYRKSARFLNDVLHRNEDKNEIKHRTLADNINRLGGEIADSMSQASVSILSANGFDGETGLPLRDFELPGSITGIFDKNKINDGRTEIQSAIDTINKNRDEKILHQADEIPLESKNAEDTVYVSIDEILVKAQKEVRSPNVTRDSRFVDNAVAHVQYKDKAISLTATDLNNLFKSILACLIDNDLLKFHLVFFCDGAKNIRLKIEEMFAFHPYRIVLDWFHIKKRCRESLSMAIKKQDKRNVVLEEVLRFLWVGNIDGAKAYLNSLDPLLIKNQKRFEDVLCYLENKRPFMTCYAVRKKLFLRNSSNTVEKANDLLVAQRQKNNGMAWTLDRSGALASIEMLYRNKQADNYFRTGKFSFAMIDVQKDLKEAV